MALPDPSDILDLFKMHSHIEHERDDDLLTDVYLPAAIDKVARTTDLDDTDDWTGQPLLTVFRIAAAMHESREVNIDIQPHIGELMSLWKPSA